MEGSNNGGHQIKITHSNQSKFRGINNLRSVLPPEKFEIDSFFQQGIIPSHVLFSLHVSQQSNSPTTIEIDERLVRNFFNSFHKLDGCRVLVEGLDIRSSSGPVEGIIVDSSLYPKLVVEFPFGRLFTSATSCQFKSFSHLPKPVLLAWEFSGGGWKSSALLYDLLTCSFFLTPSSQTLFVMIGNDEGHPLTHRSCSLRDQNSEPIINTEFILTLPGCGYSQRCRSDHNGVCQFRAHDGLLSEEEDIWCFFPKQQDSPSPHQGQGGNNSNQHVLTGLPPHITWNYIVTATPRDMIMRDILWGYLAKPVGFGGHIDDVIVEAFPHLQSILQDSTPQSHALGSLLKLGKQSIQENHSSSKENLAFTIVQCADELVTSPSMMNSVVKAQEQCPSISEWGSSYLPSYVQHHKEALAADVGMTSLQCPGRHGLTRSTGSVLEFFCDGCGATKLQNHPYFWECRTCDYDLCMRCWNPRFSAELCPFHEHGHDPESLANAPPIPSLPNETLEDELTAAGVPYHSVAQWVSQVNYGGVSTPLKAVVRSYTGQWYYRDLNDLLRRHKGPLSEIPRYRVVTNALREAVQQIPCQYAGRNLFRGQSVLGNQTYPVGAEVTWNAFTSTTINLKTAENFARDGYIFEIIGGIPESFCASVTPLSVYPSEEEVLLIPSLTFRVTSNHGSRIQLRVVENSFPVVSSSPSSSSTSANAKSSSQCSLCTFEESISGNPLSETTALDLLSQEKFLLNVLSSKEKFETRIAYQWSSNSQKTVVPIASRRPWLYAAARNNLSEVTHQLMRLGCDPCATIDLGSTALHAASFYGNEFCVENILKNCDRSLLLQLLSIRNSPSLGSKTAVEEARTAKIRTIIQSYREAVNK
jgi:hypothetical protein